jgi:transposase-like protein
VSSGGDPVRVGKGTDVIIAPNGLGAYTAEPERVWLWNETRGEWVVPKLQAEYIDWLLTPEWLREPRLVREFQEKIGVHTQTLYKWRKEKRFQDALKKRADELNADVATTQEVLNAVQSAAKNGDIKAAQLWLQFRGELTQRTEIAVVDDLRGKPTEELIATLKHEIAVLESSMRPPELDAGEEDIEDAEIVGESN